MVQLIQKVINAFRIPSMLDVNNFDNVDPNLVRYYRTEYGRNWKNALNEHLYSINKNKYIRQD